MAQEGMIRIHRSLGGSGAAFQVTFASYDAEKEVAGVRRFRELQQVREFLRVLGIGADYIREALRQLAAGRSASLSDVRLSDTAFRRAGFVNSDNLARSIS
ncbi:MAG TPA: hypothetical protein VHE23_01690 [Candidatus Acidoferrales bacterium]|jgi:hypothetical protein|nr:hypothetical protein [Candidatus Acidoferrales bacterium]